MTGNQPIRGDRFRSRVDGSLATPKECHWLLAIRLNDLRSHVCWRNKGRNLKDYEDKGKFVTEKVIKVGEILREFFIEEL